MALNPANGAQHVAVWIDEDDHSAGQMWEAQWGNRKGASFKKWHLCAICNRLYPEGKIRQFKGKWLCLPYHHYHDAVVDTK